MREIRQKTAFLLPKLWHRTSTTFSSYPSPDIELTEPAQSKDNSGCGFKADVKHTSSPNVKDHRYGVRVLHDCGRNATVDVVFVHGLGGNAFDTWYHKSSNVFWPGELLSQDLPRSRILSFGYHAEVSGFLQGRSQSRLADHANNLVGQLETVRNQSNTNDRKICFVVHGLGGLIIAHALDCSRNSPESYLGSIEKATVGILSLSVPYGGSRLTMWAGLAAKLALICGGRSIPKELIAAQKPGSEMLLLVVNNFHNFIRIRRSEKSEVFLTAFFEELPTFRRFTVVPRQSAAIRGYPCYGVHANHSGIARFATRENESYRMIAGQLQRWNDHILHSLTTTREAENRASPEPVDACQQSAHQTKNHHLLLDNSTFRRHVYGAPSFNWPSQAQFHAQSETSVASPVEYTQAILDGVSSGPTPAAKAIPSHWCEAKAEGTGKEHLNVKK